MPDSTSEFHDIVVANFAELKTSNVEILRRLKEINGSVADVTRKYNELSVALIKHQVDCPGIKSLGMQLEEFREQVLRGEQPPAREGVARLVELERKVMLLDQQAVAAQKTENATKSVAGWFFNNLVKPVASVLIAALVLLILNNSGLFVMQHGASSTMQTTTRTTESAK
jgi:hypothetical protein